jgi:hypothetical protein
MKQASRPLVLVSWDGAAEPLAMIHLDARPEFDWLLFDFSGRQAPGRHELRGQSVTVLARSTECKGELYQALAEHLLETGQSPEYVALIDDDILIAISDINRALHLGRRAGLDVFSPTLSHDSVYTHRWTLRQPSRLLRPVDWVEVMMPFYRGALFLAGAPHYAGNISSWGIDKYLLPTLQQLSGMHRTALLDAVMASHMRPVTSGQKIYRNGRSAGEESALLKALCQRLIAEQRPELLVSEWYRRIFLQRHARSRWQQLLYGLGRPLRRWLEQST